MLKFLIFFLTTYVMMHTLFYFRIRVILPDTRLVKWLSFLFLLTMILSPLSTRILEKLGHDFSAQIMAYIAFYWMGFIFLAFSGSFFMGIFDTLAWGINAFTRFNMPLLSGKTPAFVLLGIVTALCLYGFFEAQILKTEYLHLTTDKLPNTKNSLRIVQISDIHLGLTARHKKLKAITDKIQSLSPDILVCTGDLLDNPVDHLPELADMFRQIRPPYGKYAVTGNHEYYVGIAYAMDFMKQSGFTVLRGQVKTIDARINIAGVDDEHFMVSPEQERATLASVQNGLFTLFLKHRPDIVEETIGLFDLQLSGHTHGGQIFPFNFLVALEYPFLSGYYNLSENSGIYVNRGSGTWGPQMRILSPCEITVIELKN